MHSTADWYLQSLSVGMGASITLGYEFAYSLATVALSLGACKAKVAQETAISGRDPAAQT